MLSWCAVRMIAQLLGSLFCFHFCRPRLFTIGRSLFLLIAAFWKYGHLLTLLYHYLALTLYTATVWVPVLGVLLLLTRWLYSRCRTARARGRESLPAVQSVDEAWAEWQLRESRRHPATAAPPPPPPPPDHRPSHTFPQYHPLPSFSASSDLRLGRAPQAASPSSDVTSWRQFRPSSTPTASSHAVSPSAPPLLRKRPPPSPPPPSSSLPPRAGRRKRKAEDVESDAQPEELNDEEEEKEEEGEDGTDEESEERSNGDEEGQEVEEAQGKRRRRRKTVRRREDSEDDEMEDEPSDGSATNGNTVSDMEDGADKAEEEDDEEDEDEVEMSEDGEEEEEEERETVKTTPTSVKNSGSSSSSRRRSSIPHTKNHTQKRRKVNEGKSATAHR